MRDAHRYHSGEVRASVKLLDGGIVDTIDGLAGFTIARLASGNSLRAPAARRGRETAAHAISKSSMPKSRAVGCLVADRGRPLRRQPD